MSWPLQQLRRCSGQIGSLYFHSSLCCLPLRLRAAAAHSADLDDVFSLQPYRGEVVISMPRLRPFAMTLLLSAVSMAPALAAGKITFVSQGGTYQEAQTKAILDPAAKELGITINQDSIPDAWPQIKAQAATGKPIWDVVDTPTSNCLRGGREGLLEKLDFSKMPNAAAIPEKYRTPYSVAYEFYST